MVRPKHEKILAINAEQINSTDENKNDDDVVVERRTSTKTVNELEIDSIENSNCNLCNFLNFHRRNDVELTIMLRNSWIVTN